MSTAPPGPGSGGPGGVRGRALVLSASWARARGGERHSAVRGVAGALSRHADVDVLVPGPPGPRPGDGAFDLAGVGEPAPGRRWPVSPDPAWRAGAATGEGPRYLLVLVDAGDDEAPALAARVAPGAPVVAVGTALDARASGGAGPAALLAVDLRTSPGTGAAAVGLSVRVHPDAALLPHDGVRRTSPYLLVLGDRPGAAPSGDPPGELARWLLARFARGHVVVVDQSTAGIWRSRSLVGEFRVSTRMDLWRLIAHAWATVDLAPGHLYARECVESLRYGVPVVARAGSPADGLAAAGGAACFTGSAGLLDCVEALCDPDHRAGAAAAGRALASSWYGDPAAFVDRVARALGVGHATG